MFARTHLQIIKSNLTILAPNTAALNLRRWLMYVIIAVLSIGMKNVLNMVVII